MSTKKYQHGKSKFQDRWLNDSHLAQWIQKVPNDSFVAKCKFCPGTLISVTSMGRQALISHMQGKKHRQACSMTASPTLGAYLHQDRKINKNLDLPVTQNISTPSSSCTESKEVSLLSSSTNIKMLEPPSKKMKTMDMFLQKENITKAEIIWSLHTIKSHLSLRAAGNSTALFKLMFPNDEIAQGMQLQKSKVQYYTVYGLGPFFKQMLKNRISNCSHFVVGFDESLNKVAQQQQMDINIRFWDEENQIAVTHYYDSVFLEKTTAEDLLNGLKSSLGDTNLKRMLQISMDGPNVNFKLFKLLKEELATEPEDQKLLDIGSCGLHTIHCAFKNGMKATGWQVVPFLRAIYNLFKDVPSRRGHFKTITGSELFPLKLCAIRWLENEDVVERASKLLQKIEHYVQSVKNTPKEPKCQSFTIVEEAMRCKLLRAQLAFFQAVSAQVSPFLREFQSDNPLAPFLHTVLSTLVSSILKQVVKSEVLDSNTISKINLKDKEILLDAKSVDLGFGSRSALRQCKNTTTKDILVFREECKRCLVAFTEKVLSRSPLKFKLTKGLTCLDPKVILLSNGANKVLQTTLEVFVESNLISGAMADRTANQFNELIANESVKEKMKKFSRTNMSLDRFWMDLIKSTVPGKEHADLMFLIKTVCIISHGNANLERGFSINKECLVVNQQRESLVAQRLITEAINSAGGVEMMEISKGMIHAVRNSRSLYEDRLKEHRKEEEDRKKEASEKKKTAARLKELEKEKAKLEEETRLKVSAIQEELLELKSHLFLAGFE